MKKRNRNTIWPQRPFARPLKATGRPVAHWFESRRRKARAEADLLAKLETYYRANKAPVAITMWPD